VIKMRHLYNNKKGISNVLGYLLSFAIASIVMVSAVIITSGIINNRTAAVAELQAQSIANKVADAIVEAVTVDQSMPEGDYTKTMDIPLDIAGRQYYIEITDAAVYVNTTDGIVSKSAPTYGAGSSKTGISSDTIYSGGSEIEISLERSDVIYKFDFGTGNNTEHSPVESGYYTVSNTSSAYPEMLNPPWWNQSYPYRVPIRVENDAIQDVDEATVKIVLNPSNFDYSLANVTVISPSIVSSNLAFVDAHFSIVANIEVNHDIWYTWWADRETDDDVEIRITELSEGYNIGDIQANTVKLNGYLSWETWEGSATPHFDADAALKSISSSGGPGSKFLPPSPGDYTVTISGLLDDGASFSGRKVITVADGDILVDNAFDEHTPGWGYTHFNNIQNAISAASTGDTIFVYNGIYDENILINKQIRLFGEDRMDTIIDGSAGNDHTIEVTADYVHIDSFAVRGGSGSGVHNGNGILLDGIENAIISSCNIYSNRWDGIKLWGSNHNTIVDCEVYWNGNDTSMNGIHLVYSDYNTIRNCDVHHQIGTGDPPEDEYADGIDIDDPWDTWGGNSDYNIIENCEIHDNNDDGVDFEYLADNNTIRNCSIYNNAVRGIQLQKDDGYNTITNCSIYSNTQQGILIYNSRHSSITDCKIYDNDITGIYFLGEIGDPADYNIISNCEIYGNKNDGIRLHGMVARNTIRYCDLHHNANPNGNGSIEFYFGPNNNTVKYCNVHHNTKSGGADGIGFMFSVWNNISNCNFYNNDWGVCVFASGLNNKFEWCQFHDNTHDGAYLEYGANSNAFVNCDFYFNGEDGATLTKEVFYNWFTLCNFFDNGDDGVDMIGIDGLNFVPIATNLVGQSNIFGNKYGVFISGGPLTKFNAFYYNNIEFNSKNIANGYQGRADMFTFLSWLQHDNLLHPFAWIDGNAIGNWWGDYADGYREDISIDGVDYEDVYELKEYGGIKMIDRFPVNHVDIEWPINPLQDGQRITGHDQRMFIQVDDNADGDWYDYYHVATITEGLSHVTDKGTIYIHNGEYNEGFAINKKGITMFGESRDGVVINGTGLSGNLINVNRDDVDIRSLTIYNGKTSGIYIYNNDHINITDCNIYSERSDDPQSCINIGASGSSEITIENCEIYSNKNTDYGIKIYNEANGVQIIDCEIYSHDRHGIYLDDEVGDTIITDCEIYSNDGSGICFDDNSDQNEIYNCKIYNNDDYGISLEGHSDGNDIVNCNIYDNDISGIYVKYSHGNTFTKYMIIQIKMRFINVRYTTILMAYILKTIQIKTRLQTVKVI